MRLGTRTLWRRAAAGVLAFVTCSCANEPGQPWGAAELSLTVQLEVPPDRQLANGGIRTAAGYALYLQEVALEVREVSLLVRPTGSTSSVFDPAKPPANYSLCHNGHCHRDDGALVDYADIEAELLAASGAKAATPGVTLALAETATMTASSAVVPLPACSAKDPCDLPRGTLQTARVRVAALRLVGVVKDADGLGRLPAQGITLELEIPLQVGDQLLGAAASLAGPLDNGQPAGVRARLRLSLSPTWLDGADVAALANGKPALVSQDLQAQLADIQERFRSDTTLAVQLDRFYL
jgi:hypothetical protein